jgi:hypothetical protein
MKIYHGTDADWLPRILQEGLKPRKMTSKSNWKEFVSLPDKVYLTATYPLYFASCVSKSRMAAVIEIEIDLLDEHNLYPDEDFISQAYQQADQFKDLSLQLIQDAVKRNLNRFKNAWKDSIQHMGTVSHKGIIKPDCFTRYAIVDLKRRGQLTCSMLDPTICILNHKIKGQFYKDFVAWVFGDRKELPQLDEAKRFDKMKLFCGVQGHSPVVFWRQQSRDRSGIEVHILNNKQKRETECLSTVQPQGQSHM